MQLDLDAERISFLYRFSTAAAKGRVLEVNVSANNEPVLRGGNWTESTVVNLLPPHSASSSESHRTVSSNQRLCCIASYDKELPFAKGSFDAIVMHGTLDEIMQVSRREGRQFDMGGFLSRVSKVMAVGGIVAGCVENRHSLEDFFHERILNRSDSAGRAARLPPTFSVNDCHAALTAAGFRDIRLFSVLPNARSPKKLLSIDNAWSRRASKRHVQALRPLVSRSAYMVWRLLAELGVSQHLGRAIFFSARKECSR